MEVLTFGSYFNQPLGDSLSNLIQVKLSGLKVSLNSYFHFNDSLRRNIKPIIDTAVKDSLLAQFDRFNQQLLVSAALNHARSARGYVDYAISDVGDTARIRNKFDMEWHRKFTLSVACIIMFFIGAPFGAIIRKGGFGMPLVISVIFYIVYHILSITGEKMVKTDTATAFSGMWVAILILTPIGILLTYLASTDSSLFDKASWKSAFMRLIFWVKRK